MVDLTLPSMVVSCVLRVSVADKSGNHLLEFAPQDNAGLRSGKMKLQGDDTCRGGGEANRDFFLPDAANLKFLRIFQNLSESRRIC